MTVRILIGDCRDVLATRPDQSVHCCVTSPPYFGLRDYGVDGQMGLEATPDEFVAGMVAVFRGVRRVLRDDGTLWLNIGDSYAGSGRGGYAGGASTLDGTTVGQDNARQARGLQLAAGLHANSVSAGAITRAWVPPPAGLKQKDLIGIPWMLAFALRADGWYLRQEIIWHKPNPMPESVTDRCTKAHESLFLLSKSPRYYFDADAIAEGLAEASVARLAQNVEAQAGSERVPGKTNGAMKAVGGGATRNKRSVWTVPTQPFKEAHFATFPPALVKPCILAGCQAGGTVLDPFGGAGTTGLVADRLQRDALLIELNPAYAAIADARIRGDAGLFASPAADAAVRAAA